MIAPRSNPPARPRSPLWSALAPAALVALFGCAADPKATEEDADKDGFGVSEDCNDADPAVNPGAVELCNELDDDCDSTVDDGVTTQAWPDADGDGFGVIGRYVWACSPPAGYAATNDDCDDTNASVNPAATEVCNGIDDNCDLISDADQSSIVYTDSDGDGYGDPTTGVESCFAEPGQVEDGTDCDDTDNTVNPGASEVCGDGDDDDCDGYPDIAGAISAWYRDDDGDGYGYTSTVITACDPPEGWVEVGGDCNPTNAEAYPGALEVCNDIDDDCNGFVDEIGDVDEDGYEASDCGGLDCDDLDPEVHPGAEEITDDDIDNDCDGHDTFGGYDPEYALSVASAKLYAPNASMDAGRLLDSGDVDGDGYDELLVATLYANSYNGGGYLVYGSPATGKSSLATAGVRIAGVAQTYGASRSIGLGDVDGDGFEDIGFGAPWASTPNMTVLYGPVTASTTLASADATLQGQGNSYFSHGSDLADVNGDGIADAVIGAYYTGGGTGTLYVEYGPLSGTINMLSGADATVTGTAASGYLGRNLRAGADMDGDGIGDIIVPAVYASVGPSQSGVTYVLYGPLSGSSTMASADGTFSGEGAGDYSGYCVSQGDVNGDGLADALIGSYNSTAGSQAGAMYVVFGPASGSASLSTADVIIRGDTASQQFGLGNWSDDVDSDGQDELFVGAPGDNGTGGAFLFFAPLSAGTYAASDAEVHLTGERTSDYVGHGVAIGDFDGDGFGDLAMGALNEATGGSGAGAAYIQFPYE
jgi:hypothetical protein